MEREAVDVLAAADIGGTTVKLGLFDENITLLEKSEIPTDRADGGKNILASLCRALKGMAGNRHIRGVGVGVPGAVNEKAEVPGCVNLGWGYTDLGSEVRRYLTDTEVFAFANDATAAAMGEMSFGAGKGYSSAYLLTLGTGIGGGCAYKGGVINGAHGAAGEIGHLKINPFETARCSCGGRGCLEQYASADGIVRLARNIISLKQRSALCREGEDAAALHIERLFVPDIPTETSPLEELELFSSRDICTLALKGDPLSASVIQTWGRCMGLALSSISCSIDPEVFIIGGGMSGAGSILTEAILPYFRQYAYPDAAETQIMLARLGNDAGIYGCACLAAGALKEKYG